MSFRTPSTNVDRPIPTLELLRSAACYAEFALLAGTWSTTGIEEALDDRGPARRNETKTRPSGSNLYRRYLAGGVPKAYKIKDIVVKRPKTNLAAWSEHLLGQLICDLHLHYIDVITPTYDLQSLEWTNFLVSKRWRDEEPAMVGSRFASNPFANRRDYFGPQVTELTYLLARIRIDKCDEKLKFDLIMRLFDIIPAAVGRSPHLYLARDVFLACLRDFMSWPLHHPGSGPFVLQERYAESHWNELKRKIHEEQIMSRREGINLPEERLVQKYTERLGKVTTPFLR